MSCEENLDKILKEAKNIDDIRAQLTSGQVCTREEVTEVLKRNPSIKDRVMNLIKREG